MLARPESATLEDLQLMNRQQLIDQILAFNEGATFAFSQTWLNKQRTRRLRELLCDRLEQSSDSSES